MKLCYKAAHPLEILTSSMLKTSTLDRRDRGLSMTTNQQESGHGCFMFKFKQGLAWYSQFIACVYDDSLPGSPLNKKSFFAVEQEWWSPDSVVFQMADIEAIVFMSNSPAARIHPRKSRRVWQEVQAAYGNKLKLIEDTDYYPKD